jgi:hypothetical protein
VPRLESNPTMSDQFKAQRKYLERHAEAEVDCSENWPDEAGPYAHVLCVPAYGEGQSLLDMLSSVPTPGNQPILIILIVNQQESAPTWARHTNEWVLNGLRNNSDSLRRLTPHVEWIRSSLHDLLLVDRTQDGSCLPPDQGVGLARKIAADIALQLQAQGIVESSWIHCTDADALVPSDYFEREPKPEESKSHTVSALVHDFRHDFSSETDSGRAILRYEIYLRYYVLGLREARSPYAYHSIGSTISIDGLCYARVRGFPKRLAAEDFHMLAKLAKVGRIESTRGTPIVLSARASDRVPFGTGAAIRKDRLRQEQGDDFRAYDPEVFRWLSLWLRAMRDFGDPDCRGEDLRSHLQRHCREELSARDALLLHDVLEEIGAIARANKAAERPRNIARSLEESFDALRTLRFIHTLRDRRFPDIALGQAVVAAPFLDVDHWEDESAATLESICRTMARLEAKNA